MVKFGCSKRKMLTADAQHVLRRALAQGTFDFIMWRCGRGKLPGSADEVGR